MATAMHLGTVSHTATALPSTNKYRTAFKVHATTNLGVAGERVDKLAVTGLPDLDGLVRGCGAKEGAKQHTSTYE